jgi:L-malate glycosyltransferase
MNILISVTDLCVGGGQNFAVRLAKALSKGHSVILFNYETFQKRGDSLSLEELPDSLKIISLPAPIYWLTKAIDAIFLRLGASFSSWNFVQTLSLKLLIAWYQVNVVNSHLHTSDDFVTTVLQTSKTPIIISDHGDYRYIVETGLSNLDEINLIFERVNAIAYPSHSNAQVTSKFTSYSTILERVIYYGFPDKNRKNYVESARKKLGISDIAFVFGMVARGIPEKGWKETIQAFKLVQSLSDRDIHLILVGGSDYLTELEHELKLQATFNIHFTGYSSDPEYWISSFDVGLLPTYFPGESLPNSVIEYLFAGKPVIATGVGGISEMITHSEQQAGFIVDLSSDGKGDVPKLVDAMLRYIQDVKLFEIHSSLTQKAFEKFKMQTCVEAYEKLFQQVLMDSTH